MSAVGLLPSARVRPPLRQWLAVVALCGLALAGCGADPPSAPEAFCDSLRAVGELDRENERALAQAQNWPATQRALVSALQRADAAYRKAAPIAPPALQAEVTTLQRFTARTATAAQAAASLEAFQASALSDRQAAMAAGEASQSIDAHTRAECGFSINNEQ